MKPIIQYIRRCVIVERHGALLPGSSCYAVTPPKSKPYIGKRGLAIPYSDESVVILLDDATVLRENDCWWDVIE